MSTESTQGTVNYDFGTKTCPYVNISDVYYKRDKTVG